MIETQGRRKEPKTANPRRSGFTLRRSSRDHQGVKGTGAQPTSDTNVFKGNGEKSGRDQKKSQGKDGQRGEKGRAGTVPDPGRNGKKTPDDVET